MGEEKAARATWRDWLHPSIPPPVSLISRAEVLVGLSARGIAMNERKLRSWEAKGALPYGEPTEDVSGRPLRYPEWYAEVVTDAVKTRERLHLSLGQLGPYTQAILAQRALGVPVPGTRLRIEPELQRALVALAQQQLELVGTVRIEFLRMDGTVINSGGLTIVESWQHIAGDAVLRGG